MHRLRIVLLAALASLAATTLAAQTPIRVGQTVTGTLDEGDLQFDMGAYYDSYVIRGRPGERVVVLMRSEEFDTYLRWGSDSEGDWIDVEANDDGGEGTNSRMVVTLGAQGEWELRASAFSEYHMGDYELTVSQVAAVVPGRIRPGMTVGGELTDEDFVGENGPEDHWILRLDGDEVVTAWLESEDFDTYLLFGGWRDGEFWEFESNDDGGDGTNSLLVAEPADDGQHRLIVRSFSGEGRGQYLLRLEPGAQVPDDYYGVDTVAIPVTDTVWAPVGYDTVVWTSADTVAWSTDSVLIGLLPGPYPGEPLHATLDGLIGEDEDGHWYADHAYYGSAGEEITLDLSSADFDPVVSIGLGERENFRALETDDDSGPGNDARTRFTVPQDGMYVIRVTSARPGAGGMYTLLVSN